MGVHSKRNLVVDGHAQLMKPIDRAGVNSEHDLVDELCPPNHQHDACTSHTCHAMCAFSPGVGSPRAIL